MIPYGDALERVLEGCRTLPPVRLPLVDAFGSVAAERVVSRDLIPPFDNSAMDGFAVRAADVAEAPVRLRVTGTMAAGSSAQLTVEAGHAVRIMTGAPMPRGADSIVIVEDTVLVEPVEVAGDAGRDGAPDSQDSGVETVEVRRPTSPGRHVRRAGDDLRPGDPVVEPGTDLTPAHIGLLATVGSTDVAVYRRPRVGVMSTGDELVTGSAELLPGQIRDSNRPMLLALVRQAGAEAVDLGQVDDDERALSEAIQRGAAECDALVTSGGVSMGDFDYVKTVLDRLGDMSWMQVAIRPAKPLAFGLVGGTPVFGLPGNPVSSIVSFELFAGPALRKMMGHSAIERPRIRAVAGQDLPRRPDGKVHFVRVVVTVGDDGVFVARSAGAQGSHQLSAMADANGLAVLPDGEGARAGSPIQVIRLAAPRHS